MSICCNPSPPPLISRQSEDDLPYPTECRKKYGAIAKAMVYWGSKPFCTYLGEVSYLMSRGLEDRRYWLEAMQKIAYPVLYHLSRRELKQHMPVEAKLEDRPNFTYLEALGRLLAGIAPWLENYDVHGEEAELRQAYADMARSAIDAGTDPSSPDYMNFEFGFQPIVDAAFLAQAILRAPNELWEALEPRVKQQLVAALKATRTRKPGFNNWLLFAATIETALYRMGQKWDPMRVDYALKQHEQWYLGDGTYSDGPKFHWDYYNSFVIHPMLLDIVDTLSEQYWDWTSVKEPIERRAVRHATVLERLISPEGTYPAIGRSIVYRFGAFQLLSQIALKRKLDPTLAPAQVRCALTAVIRRTLDMPRTFDDNGWLTIGLAGHQPELGEEYISTGSLYLCSMVFLPLGLPAGDAFWQGEEDWTSRKVWSGGQIAIDKAID